MANEEHLARLKQGIDQWNTWRQQHRDVQPDLSHTNLSYATLSSANLNNANLSYTDLNGTKLNNANLSYANLINANLSYANLINANLINANLSRANLSRANLNSASLGYTVFAENDLSTVNGLVEIDHRARSYISLDTIKLPQDESAVHFLRGAGVPEIFIEYLPSLLTTAIQYHSLFLSHSHRDQVFTQQLYKNLQNQGVRCWYAPHDLVPGRPMVRGIEEAIHLHEKLLLILSEHAIKSNWVKLEVEAALHKEVTTKQEILFPLRLDNTVLSSNTLWAKRLRQRHIADFTNWQDTAAYEQAFTTLLRHLKTT